MIVRAKTARQNVFITRNCSSETAHRHLHLFCCSCYLKQPTYEAANKVKAGKAPGSCGVYPEYILHGDNEALKTLHSIFTRVWEDEVVPEEWHQGIICLLYTSPSPRDGLLSRMPSSA